MGTTLLPPAVREPDPILVTLRFEPTKSGAKISWESFMGNFESRFTLPYAAQHLPIVIKALDAAQHPDHPIGGPQFSTEEQTLLTGLSLWKDGRVPNDAHRTVGRKLYVALVKDRNGERALTGVRENARNQGKPLSYILRFPKEAIELASLPWEGLRDDRQAVLLSRGTRDIDSCQRYLNMNEALSPPLPTDHKLHILVLSPQAGIPLEVREAERTARLKSWDELKAKGLLEYDELSPVTMAELDNRMRNGPQPHIIHYYGHGIYKDGSGYLVFDNPDLPKQREQVSADRLSAQLGGIRLIMIHACQSAMIGDPENQGGLLTGIAPALSAVSEAVVAMQLTVRISAATRFSEVFYKEIARGRSLQAAVAEARRSLYTIEGDGASWYVPTLYIRTRDQKPVYLVQPREAALPVTAQQESQEVQTVLSLTKKDPLTFAERRRLDGAMPGQTSVGTTTELWIQLCLLESQGFRNRLPQYIVSGEEISRDDVRGSTLPLLFPISPENGIPTAITLRILIEAPDFEVNTSFQDITVIPKHDTGTITFSMIPRKSRRLSLIHVKIRKCDATGEYTDLGSVTVRTQILSSVARLVDRVYWNIASALLSFSEANRVTAQTIKRSMIDASSINPVIREEIDDYVSLDQNQLHALIPSELYRSSDTVVMFSPDLQEEAGKKFFESIKTSLIRILCEEWNLDEFVQTHEDVRDVELILLIAKILDSRVKGMSTTLLASIVVKMGVGNLCSNHKHRTNLAPHTS